MHSTPDLTERDLYFDRMWAFDREEHYALKFGLPERARQIALERIAYREAFSKSERKEQAA